MAEIDKAYYIRESELAVLLALEGCSEVYGYPLCSMTDTSRAEMDRILFEMAGSGMLGVQDGKVRVCGEWAGIADSIAGARVLIISAETRREHSERFLYVSDSPVVLCTQFHQGGMIRIERWKRTGMAQRIIRGGVAPNSILPNTAGIPPYSAGMERGKILPDTMLLLQEMAVRLSRGSLSAVLGEKGVLSVVECHQIRQHRKTGQAVIYNQGIEDYVFVSDVEENSIYPYSEKKLTELINRWMGVV